jgi:hypothetical protein
MSRTIKDATFKRYHYDNHDRSGDTASYSFTRIFKAMQDPTLYEAIGNGSQKETARFSSDPHHQTAGLNS